MTKLDSSQMPSGKGPNVSWVKKAAAFGSKPKSFSVPEGKRVLKMLIAQGLSASAIQVAPDGGFRFELVPTLNAEKEPEENSWDEVLSNGLSRNSVKVSSHLC